MSAASERRPASDLLTFVEDLALEAGRLTQEWFRSPTLEIDMKDDGSPVTVADRQAELLIRQVIADAFPDDAIVGEEFDDTLGSGTSGREWIIDPIDGTKTFTAGVPLYSNLIAVVDDGMPVLGVLNLPAVTELISAVDGGGAHCNGERCRVSTRSSLDGAYAMTSGVRYWPHGALDALADEGVVVRTWGDAYGYALVATGRAEAMIDPLANRWDIAPIGVIIAEAGGRFTGLNGKPGVDHGNGVGTNGAIHDALLRVLPDAGRP